MAVQGKAKAAVPPNEMKEVMIWVSSDQLNDTFDQLFGNPNVIEANVRPRGDVFTVMVKYAVMDLERQQNEIRDWIQSIGNTSKE